MWAAWRSTSRYLQRAGVDSERTGSVGLQTVANIAGTAVLIGIFFALTGRRTSVDLHLHVHQWVLVIIVLVLVGGALAALTPRGRRFFHDRIWAFIRSAGTAIAGVAKSPHHVALVGLGALGGPLFRSSLSVCAPVRSATHFPSLR